MSKRAASSQLTHDNWDEEEEPEEVGTFKTASSEVLEKRVIKVAKRRTANSSFQSAPTKNVFSGFTGFGNIKPMASAQEVANTAKTSFSFLSASSEKKPELPKVNSNYLSRLRSLNEEVLAWINKNVSSSPCCILTPVFQDYDKYLKDIQNEFGVHADGKSIGPESSSKVSSISSNKGDGDGFSNKGVKEISKENMFSFGEPKASSKPFTSSFSLTNTSPSLGPTTSLVNPGKDVKKDPPSNDGGFKFSSTEKPAMPAFGSSTTSPTTPSFFSSLPSGNASGGFFSSLNKSGPAPAPTEERKETNGGDEENEDEEPPKNEFIPVKEEGAVFSQRVKVFVKKDKNFADHGIGNLYLKETPTGKYQAIVRADTSLGNILFNVILTSETPTKRVGKNNVMLVVVPTPEAKPPPVPVLLRVKTSEDADKLLEKIEEYKK